MAPTLSLSFCSKRSSLLDRVLCLGLSMREPWETLRKQKMS